MHVFAIVSLSVSPSLPSSLSLSLPPFLSLSLSLPLLHTPFLFPFLFPFLSPSLPLSLSTECIADLILLSLSQEIEDYLIASLLLARQAGLEGGHLFPPYGNWFKVRGHVYEGKREGGREGGRKREGGRERSGRLFILS